MIQQRVVLFAVILLSGVLVAPAQNNTFSVSTEEVRIDVFVTDHGKPTQNLTANDIEVFDNGIPQQIQYMTRQEQMPISTILVFDMSESVAGELLNNLKVAANSFLSNLGKKDHIALILFNHIVTLAAPLTNDLALIRTALDRAQPSGNSSLIDASYAGLILAESEPDPPLLIIFSDGLDTLSWLKSDAVLQSARRTTCVVYAVSTAQLPRKTFLRNLAEITNGTLFEIGSSGNLATVFLHILDEFRQRYLVTYMPRGVSEGGWHKLEVRVKKLKATVRTRPGYMRIPLENIPEKPGM
jgi:Ca-activated chloride channel homolog